MKEDADDHVIWPRLIFSAVARQAADRNQGQHRPANTVEFRGVLGGCGVPGWRVHPVGGWRGPTRWFQVRAPFTRWRVEVRSGRGGGWVGG